MAKLRDQIRQDFLKAYKGRETQKAEALRGLENSLKDVEIDSRKDISDEEAVKILRKELKKREEAIVLYKKGGRKELSEKEEYEAEIIKFYLPKQMSRKEIEKVVDEVLAKAGEKPNFGQVMGMVMGKVKGKADGKMVGEVVKGKLGI